MTSFLSFFLSFFFSLSSLFPLERGRDWKQVERKKRIDTEKMKFDALEIRMNRVRSGRKEEAIANRAEHHDSWIIHFPKAWRKLEEKRNYPTPLITSALFFILGHGARIRDDSGKGEQRSRLMRSASIFIHESIKAVFPSPAKSTGGRRYYASFCSRFFGPLDRLS